MYPLSSPRPARKVALILATLIALFATIVSTASATAPATVPNPDLQPACGTKVILVLDESGSIQSTAGAETAVRSAANAFANGLADTGSQLAVIEFGTSAKRVFDYTTVTSGAGGTLATTFQPYFNGTASSPADVYDSPSQTGQFTNWQDALEEVNLLNTASGVAPLVVFVTDGDPTATGTSAPFATNVASATALTPAIVQANAVKAQGSHILAVGVGAALNNATSLSRLNAISGPDTVTDPASLNLSTTDVLAVSDFASLPDALRALVNQLCARSVAITKVVDQPVVTGSTLVTYTIRVTNTGDVALNNVAVADAIAPSCAATIGNLAVGAFSEYTCTATITQNTTNTATVSAKDPQGADVPPSSASATVTVTVPPITVTPPPPVTVIPTVPPGIDIAGASRTTLRIDKRGPATAKAGQVITYRIKITNTGTIAAQNVIMRDRLPGGLALAAKPAGIQIVKGVVTVTVGDLGPGASKTLLLKTRIDRTAAGARTNVATASASNAQQVRDSARTKIITIAGQIRIPIVTG
jgi:uncharacterized repeat protein (TIGR01451 family)